MASISPTILDCNYSPHVSGKTDNRCRLTITKITQNTPNNQTTVDWKITVEGTPYSYLYALYVTLGGKVLYDHHTGGAILTSWSAGQVIASGTTTFNNASDGNLTLNAYIKQMFYYGTGDSSRWTNPRYYQDNSVNMVCSQIPRTSSVSGGSGDIGGTSTINISRASGDFTHRLYYAFGNIGKTLIASNVATSYKWTLPTALYNQIPTANSGVGTIYCETYYGSTHIGTSTCTFTAKVVNSNPVFASSNISYLDTNSTIVAITGNNKHIVRNLSTLRVSFTNAAAKNGASISKYEISFNGSTQTKTSASTIDYGKVNLSSNTNLVIKVTDSRGNTTSASITIIILNWELPKAVISAKRVNNYEDETKLKVQVSISSVNSKNSIQSIKYRYKKSNATSWSAYTSINNNTEYTVSIDKLYIWNFQVEIKDKFGTATYNFNVAKGMPILMIDVDLISIGVNCFPTKQQSFEVNGYDFSALHPVNSLIMTTNNTNPSSSVTGTWELLTSASVGGTTIYYWKRTA